MFKRNEKKMFSKPKGRKNLEFRGGVEHKAHMQVVEEGKIVYNFIGGGN